MVFVYYESTFVCMKKQMCVDMYVCVCVRRHKTLVIAFNSRVERRFDSSEYPFVWLTFLLPHANIIFNLKKPINMKQTATSIKTSLCSVLHSPFPSVIKQNILIHLLCEGRYEPWGLGFPSSLQKETFWFFGVFFKFYLFIFGCIGSSLLCEGFL